MKDRLWLALRLVDLPLWIFPPQEQAVCILEKRRIIAANPAAIEAGVHKGMDATTAQLLSNCIIYERDTLQEQNYLNQCAEHLYAFTPYIHINRSAFAPDSGLILEISRCLKLFGGIESLCARLLATLTDLPIAYGLAHTEEAAWLLSYDNYSIAEGDDRALFIHRLNHVPVERLFDWPEARESLKRMGFVSLGNIAHQIERQSISAIKKRLGQDFADFIVRLFDISNNFQQTALFNKPLQIYQPKEFFFDTMQFDYPITHIDQLHAPIEQMLQQLGEYLRKRKLSCQKITWRFFDIHHNSHAINVHCAAPQTTWKLLYDLTHIQLESQQLPFAVDAIELTCQQLQSSQEKNNQLNFSGGRNKNHGGDDLALLEAKLKARLGEQAIFKISYKDSHTPEQAWNKRSVFEPTEQQLPAAHQHAPRPTWLFATPFLAKFQQQQLSWRGQLELLTSPERIETQWWTTPTARDYYIAMREDGLRVWVYEDLLEGKWFVQGIFAG